MYHVGEERGRRDLAARQLTGRQGRVGRGEDRQPPHGRIGGLVLTQPRRERCEALGGEGGVRVDEEVAETESRRPARCGGRVGRRRLHVDERVLFRPAPPKPKRARGVWRRALGLLPIFELPDLLVHELRQPRETIVHM